MSAALQTLLFRPRAAWLPQWSSGALSALKWLGLGLMVLDHVDAFAFGRSLTWAGALGRVVFPLFAVVIGYNLARDSVGAAVRSRLLRRLLLFGCLALPFHAALRGEFVPFNILFTFAAAVWVLDLSVAGRRVGALAVFLVAGALVEYGWPGLALVLGVRWLYRAPGLEPLAWVLVAWVGLYLSNGSLLALWALPLVVLASGLRVNLPRVQWVFYWFYPLHLVALWALIAP